MAEKDRVPSEILKVRKHHKQAYRFLSSALEVDESGDATIKNFKKALILYENGVHELKQGIGVKLTGTGEDYERASKLQAKMEGNLEHAESRITELTTFVESSSNDVLKEEHVTSFAEETDSNRPKSAGTNTTAAGTTVTPSSTRGSAVRAKTTVTTTTDSRNSKSNSDKFSNSLKPTKSSKYTGATKNNISEKPTSTYTSRIKKNGPKQPSADETKKISSLKNIDSKHANLILNEVVEKGRGVSFDDIGGMENAKQTLYEIVILPALRPELFTGLRAPARGFLLFGPPGNGKTLLAKAVATEANAVFFNISAASLTSKWIGEGEKMVRAMFAVARELQPAIIFIDEIDSLLSDRKENEHEASRRLKTEFLVGFDGVISDVDERILIMGATNRPWELDDAALRRLVKRVHVPLPNNETRIDILQKVLSKQPKHKITEQDFYEVGKRTENYSGSDLAALCREAALMPIRKLTPDQIKSMPADKVREINLNDFIEAMNTIRPSVSPEYLGKFNEWNKKYGSLT